MWRSLVPTAAGKTTLVKLILGLERPAKGRVLLFGHEAQDFKQWRDIGYVPQSTSAFQVRFPATVGEVVSYGKYRGLDPLAFFRRGLSPDIKRALETVNMWTYRNRLINDLSTGQQQRVLVARALVRWPKLLILDEPIAGVDIGGQEQFYSLLREIRHQDIGVTVILVSHDVGVVLHESHQGGLYQPQPPLLRRPPRSVRRGPLQPLRLARGPGHPPPRVG